MTFNGVMALFGVISPKSVASGAHCVQVVEDVVVKKFTFAISSPDEFLVSMDPAFCSVVDDRQFRYQSGFAI